MMIESFFSNAGWLFFTAYSAIVAAVSYTAFGRDLQSSEAPMKSSEKSTSADSIHPIR